MKHLEKRLKVLNKACSKALEKEDELRTSLQKYFDFEICLEYFDSDGWVVAPALEDYAISIKSVLENISKLKRGEKITRKAFGEFCF